MRKREKTSHNRKTDRRETQVKVSTQVPNTLLIIHLLIINYQMCYHRKDNSFTIFDEL